MAKIPGLHQFDDSEAAALVAIGAAAADLHEVDGVSVAVLPDGEGNWRIEPVDVEKYQEHPRRKAGTVTAREVGSFIAYVNRQKTPATLAWADGAGGIRAFINDHAPAADSIDGDPLDVGQPGWRDHVAVLKREQTTAYKAWIGHNGRDLTQQQFADFLEDRITEIIEPAGADLLEIATFFQSNTQVAFTSGKQLHNGQVELNYTEQMEERGGRAGQTKVPTEFVILLRPYKDAPAPAEGDPDVEQFVVRARLRWRVQGQKVTFRFHLGEELELHMDGIHNAAIERVRAEAAIPVLLAGAGQ